MFIIIIIIIFIFIIIFIIVIIIVIIIIIIMIGTSAISSLSRVLSAFHSAKKMMVVVVVTLVDLKKGKKVFLELEFASGNSGPRINLHDRETRECPRVVN